MLRITKIFEDTVTVRLRLDGRLDEATLPELETSVLHHRNGQGRAITLDFGGVVFVNDAAVKMLQKIKDERVSIVNCSLFVQTIIGDLLEEK